MDLEPHQIARRASSKYGCTVLTLLLAVRRVQQDRWPSAGDLLAGGLWSGTSTAPGMDGPLSNSTPPVRDPTADGVEVDVWGFWGVLMLSFAGGGAPGQSWTRYTILGFRAASKVDQVASSSILAPVTSVSSTAEHWASGATVACQERQERCTVTWSSDSAIVCGLRLQQ